MKSIPHFPAFILLALLCMGCSTAAVATPTATAGKPTGTALMQPTAPIVVAKGTATVQITVTAAPGTPIIFDPATPETKGTVVPDLPVTPTSDASAPASPEPRAVIQVSEQTTNHQASPNGAYIAFEDVRPMDMPGPGPQPSALLVATIGTDTYWEATPACYTTLCEFTWTSGQQLLWLSEGAVFIAEGDSANRRDLAAPEPMVEILGISPQDVAVLRSENNLWRLALPDGTWEEVAPPALLMRNLPGEFPLTNDRLHMTADGQSGAIIYDNQILLLPLGFGTPPMVITTFNELTYPGYDGPPIQPPVPLTGSGYWLPRWPLMLNDALPPRWMVVSQGDGAFVPLADVIGMGGSTSEPGLGQASAISGASASPDGRWLAVMMADPADPMRQATYLASTSNLTGGRMIPAIFQQWRGDSAGLILLESGTETWRLVHLRLDSGRPASAVSDDVPFANLLRSDTASSRVVTVSETRVAAYGGETELGAIAFQSETRLPVQRSDSASGLLIPPYVADMVETRAFFIAGPPDGESGTWLWVWDVN